MTVQEEGEVEGGDDPPDDEEDGAIICSKMPTMENAKTATTIPTTAHIINFLAVAFFPGSPWAVKNKKPAHINMTTETLRNTGQTIISKNLFTIPKTQVRGSTANATEGSSNNTAKEKIMVTFFFIS